MDVDPLLVRWPRPALEIVPSVAQQTRTRDAATARALEAYLDATREVPVPLHRVTV
jgi:hypothetical protein